MKSRTRRELLGCWLEALRSAGSAVAARRTVDLATALRPPGALIPDADFLAACTGCGECAPVCPVDAIRIVERENATPVPAIDPELKPCYLCSDLPCVAACPEPALADPGGPARARLGIARVNPRRCVTFRGERCSSCFKACPYPQHAIMMIGERPLVASGACTGCGLCVMACPESPKAIEVIAERLLVPGLRVPRTEYEAG